MTEGFQTSVEEVPADVVEIAREPELEVESEDVTELLQAPDRIFTDEEFLLMDEQREWFLERETMHGENAVKIIEMTITDLESFINLVEKAAVGFERIDSCVWKEVLWVKQHSCYREVVRERKNQSMWLTSLLSYFKKLLQPRNR